MRQSRIVRQIARFSGVGVVNTVVDFGVLNLLLLILGTSSGVYLICRSVAFIAAAANSFVWNKWWVFRGHGSTRTRISSRETTLFVLTAVVGLIANSFIATFALTALQALAPGLSPWILANASAVIGVTVVLGLNFISYKFLVFYPKTT